MPAIQHRTPVGKVVLQHLRPACVAVLALCLLMGVRAEVEVVLQCLQGGSQLCPRRPLAVGVISHVAPDAAVRGQRRHRPHLGRRAAVAQFERHVGIVVGRVGKVGTQSAIPPALIFALVRIAVAAHPVRGKLPIAHHLSHCQRHAAHSGVPSKTCHRAVRRHHTVVRREAVVAVARLRPFRHQHRSHRVARLGQLQLPLAIGGLQLL